METHLQGIVSILSSILQIMDGLMKKQESSVVQLLELKLQTTIEHTSL